MKPKFVETTKATTIRLMDGHIPSVVISRLAYEKMHLYVQSVTTEIGWLGIAVMEDNIVYIEDVLLLEQSVSGGNTTISADGQTKMIMELIEQNRKDDLNKLKFWGHSHVNMDVEPSAQDATTLEELKSDVDPDFFLRGIFNKAGKVKFTLYYYEAQIVVDNVNWEVEDTISDELVEEIKAEIDEKVTTFTPTYNRWQGNTYVPPYNTHLQKNKAIEQWNRAMLSQLGIDGFEDFTDEEIQSMMDGDYDLPDDEQDDLNNSDLESPDEDLFENMPEDDIDENDIDDELEKRGVA